MNFIRRFKKAYLSVSLFYIILGLVFLIRPGVSATMICYICGMVMIAGGIVEVLRCFFSKSGGESLYVNLIIGIPIILVGIFVMTKPRFIISMAPLLIGIVILLDGAVRFQNAVALRREGYVRWWSILVLVVILIGFGLVLMANPFKAAAVFIRIMGLYLLIEGIANIWNIYGISHNYRK